MDKIDKQWFYESSGKRVGPVSEEEIILLIKATTIGYGDCVWTSGDADWINVEQSIFKDYLSQTTPPPIKGAKVNNTVVWLLAFAPILSSILVLVILTAIHDGREYRILKAYYNGDFWWIAIIINIFLSVLDENMLKKSGHNTAKFKGWVWLVPVYLFQRAKVLKQNYAYWIVSRYVQVSI